MKLSNSVLKYTLIAVLVVVLGGLAGWYYFLRGAESTTSADDAARGYDVTAPSFTGPTGSTNANVMTVLGASAEGTSTPGSRLWEVSQEPIAGFGWIEGTSSPTLYFVDRASGNVLQAQTNGEVVLRLSDTLRPETYQAFVALDGSIVERTIDSTGSIVTFEGSVASSSSSTTTPDSLIGSDLPANIGTMAVDAGSDTLYYTIPNATGVSLVSTSWNGTKEKPLFSSPLDGWRLIAPGGGTLVLLQNPADNVTGYAYTLQKSGSLALLAEGPGLTVLPRASSTTLLFGISQGGTLSLYSQSAAGSSPVLLAIHTIADKCAWAPGAAAIAYCGVPTTVSSQQFLDDWYKGIVHTSDSIYEVDAGAASTTMLFDTTADTSAKLDVVDPSVDPSGKYIAFINGADQSLWILRIAQ